MLDCVAACIGNQPTDLRSNNPGTPWRFPLQLFLLTTDHVVGLWGEVRGGWGELLRRPIRSKNRLNGKEKIFDFSPVLLAGLHFPLRTANSHYGKIYSYTISSVMHNHELLWNHNYILRITVKDARTWEVSNSVPRKFLANRARAITFPLRSAASFDSR